MPLLIAMHGGFGSAEDLQRQSQLSNKADAAEFIVVHPEVPNRHEVSRSEPLHKSKPLIISNNYSIFESKPNGSEELKTVVRAILRLN